MAIPVVAGLLLERADLLELQRIIRLVERVRESNGLPAHSPPTDMLKAQVAAVIGAERTPNGLTQHGSDTCWVSTAEWAARRGCTARTARRHAERCGVKQDGRWLIPLPIQED